MDARVDEEGTKYGSVGSHIRAIGSGKGILKGAVNGSRLSFLDITPELVWTADKYISRKYGGLDNFSQGSNVYFATLDYIPFPYGGCWLQVYSAMSTVESDKSGIAFYDANKKFISGSDYNRETKKLAFRRIFCPDGTAYIRMSCMGQDNLNGVGIWLDDYRISVGHLVDRAVTHEKLAEKSVETDNLADEAITSEKLCDNAVQVKNAAFLEIPLEIVLTPDLYIARAKGDLRTYTPGTNTYFATEDYLPFPYGGSKCLLRASMSTASTDVSGLAFYDQDKKYISGLKYNQEKGGILSYTDFICPKGTAYIRLTMYKENLKDFAKIWFMDEEKEAANKRCPLERYHECALEQSFMELLYSMKRDFEQHGDASMIVAMFDNAYEQAVRLANNNSISVQRMATVENQIKEMEERLQDAISHQVAALREAALEQNVELNEALSNGEVTIDDIDLDIRSGLTPGSIGVSFYGTETEEGSEAQIYTELVNDLQERLKTLQQERQTIEEEQGVLAIMKKNFEYFLACLKELPDTNAGGMPLRVNGLDVQGTLLRDVDGNAIEGRKRAITSGKLKLTPERIAEAPDMLHFEKGIYCAFVESGVLQGDVATYKTNFGVTLTSKGNRRTLDSFMGYKRSDMDGNVVYVDAPYKVYGFSIQYRRYLTTAAKREREEAV